MLRLARLAFVAAALCFLFVALDRWWPCFGAGAESSACALRQDDSFDAGLVLGGEWTLHLIARTAAYVLLGLGMVLAAHASTTTPWRLACGWAGAALPWLTALGPTTGFGALALGVAMIFLSLAVGFLAYASVQSEPTPRRWPLAYGAAIALTPLLVDFFVAPVFNSGFVSHDNTPGMWLPSAIGCTAAAVVLRRRRVGARGDVASRPLLLERPATSNQGPEI